MRKLPGALPTRALHFLDQLLLLDAELHLPSVAQYSTEFWTVNGENR
jgi:hypothetical protein